jgi:hypothetical protein
MIASESTPDHLVGSSLPVVLRPAESRVRYEFSVQHTPGQWTDWAQLAVDTDKEAEDFATASRARVMWRRQAGSPSTIEPAALPADIRRHIEARIKAAESAANTDAGEGNVRVPANILRRLLEMIDTTAPLHRPSGALSVVLDPQFQLHCAAMRSALPGAAFAAVQTNLAAYVEQQQRTPKTLANLLIEWWTTDMDDAEIWNRAAGLLGITTLDLQNDAVASRSKAT